MIEGEKERAGWKGESESDGKRIKDSFRAGQTPYGIGSRKKN